MNQVKGTCAIAFIIVLFFICVYVLACVWTQVWYMWWYVYTFMDMWRLKVDIRCLPLSLFTLYIDTISKHSGWGASFRDSLSLPPEV